MSTNTQPQERISIDDTINRAVHYYQTGQLSEAESLLNQLVSKNPQHQNALHLLSIVTYSIGNTPQAIKIINRAIKINPKHASLHSDMAEFLRSEKRLKPAITHGNKAVLLDPNSLQAQLNLAACYLDAQKLKLAEQHYRAALAISPQCAAALNGLGGVLKKQNQTEEAVSLFRQSLEVEPRRAETLSNLGSILAFEERTREEGLQFLHRAITVDPNFFDAYFNLGLVYFDLENYKLARDCFIEALNIHAKNLNALLKLAAVYHRMDDLPEAEEIMLRAIAASPRRAQSYTFLAQIYGQMNKIGLAKSNVRFATTLSSKSVPVLTASGNVLLEIGDMDEAQKKFNAALALSPDNVNARFQLTYAAKVTADDANFKKLLEMEQNIDSLSPEQRIYLHFGLGKSYEDIGEYKISFEHFMKGCKLKRETFTYNPNNNSAYVNHLINTFNAHYIKKWSGYGDASDTPIFVMGMPRSGTTLTEQIIASHPAVYGAGELKDLMSLINSTGVNSQSDVYNQTWVHPNKEMFAAFAYIYLEQIKARASAHVLRVTDKMPANFFGLGLIHLALPNAKIIHVKRNPLDTCISGFTKLFGQGQQHSYDLAESGQFYYDYSRLMDHWRRVLPEGSFIEVRYEELIADTENQAKRLIEYCGLKWDDACLNFHKTKRNIRTASVTQVRRPIYQSSLERWRHYEEFLWPLRNALKEYNPS